MFIKRQQNELLIKEYQNKKMNFWFGCLTKLCQKHKHEKHTIYGQQKDIKEQIKSKDSLDVKKR